MTEDPVQGNRPILLNDHHLSGPFGFKSIRHFEGGQSHVQRSRYLDIHKSSKNVFTRGTAAISFFYFYFIA